MLPQDIPRPHPGQNREVRPGSEDFRVSVEGSFKNKTKKINMKMKLLFSLSFNYNFQNKKQFNI